MKAQFILTVNEDGSLSLSRPDRVLTNFTAAKTIVRARSRYSEFAPGILDEKFFVTVGCRLVSISVKIEGDSFMADGVVQQQ